MENLSVRAIEIVNYLHTERLDYPSEYVPLIDALNKLAAIEDILGDDYNLDHLRELVQAEQDGRLVVLPVPIGEDKLAYGLTDPDDGPQRIETIECYYLDRLEIWPTGEVVVEVGGWEIGESDIGKTVFLTEAEAEAALKGGMAEMAMLYGTLDEIIDLCDDIPAGAEPPEKEA